MSDLVEPMIHEDALPGHESQLEPKPDWQPRYNGSAASKGKVAIVTGADSGIGRAVAALFAREGADIAIVYLCEHDDAAKTKAIVEKESRRAITIAGDIGDKEFCERAVKQTVDELGRLDIWSTMPASSIPTRTFATSARSSSAGTFQTNIFGMFLIPRPRGRTSRKGRRSSTAPR